MNVWTVDFWKAAGARALRTAAQVLAGFLVVNVALWDIDWAQALGVTGTATVLSVLMSIAGPSGPDKQYGDGPASVAEYHGRRRAEDRLTEGGEGEPGR